MKKKMFLSLLVGILLSVSIGFSSSNAITQTRYASYLKGTMSFSKSGNKVSNGNVLSVVKNPGYYTGSYNNTLKRPVLINNNTEYKIYSAGLWWDLGDGKAKTIYVDIPGFK